MSLPYSMPEGWAHAEGWGNPALVKPLSGYYKNSAMTAGSELAKTLGFTLSSTQVVLLYTELQIERNMK